MNKKHKAERYHDRLCNKVANILKQEGYDVQTHLEYKVNGTSIGEIDVLGYKDGHLALYEIKGTHSFMNYCKAKKQLDRAVNKYVPTIDKELIQVDTFYITSKDL